MLGPAFGRTIFRKFYFWASGFFSQIFLAGFFFSFFFLGGGGEVPRKFLQENRRQNPPIFLEQKSSETFLPIGRAIKNNPSRLDIMS